MKLDKPINIIFAGVGGQGVLTASEALGRASLCDGFDIKKSEVHGMAQRGGSVFSHVRFGSKVHSPLVPAGTADFLVAFEGLEALRQAHRLKPGGVIILNRLNIPPMPGGAAYPHDIEKMLAGRDAEEAEVVAVPALELAGSAGDERAAGSALLGALSGFLPLSPGSWRTAFQQMFRPGAAEANMAAFRLGRSWVSTALR